MLKMNNNSNHHHHHHQLLKSNMNIDLKVKRQSNMFYGFNLQAIKNQCHGIYTPKRAWEYIGTYIYSIWWCLRARGKRWLFGKSNANAIGLTVCIYNRSMFIWYIWMNEKTPTSASHIKKMYSNICAEIVNLSMCLRFTSSILVCGPLQFWAPHIFFFVRFNLRKHRLCTIIIIIICRLSLSRGQIHTIYARKYILYMHARVLIETPNLHGIGFSKPGFRSSKRRALE